MSKREYNISPRCWDGISQLARMYPNNGLKSPVSESIVSFSFLWTIRRSAHFHLKATSLGCKFQPSRIILYRKRRISTAEKFYAVVLSALNMPSGEQQLGQDSFGSEVKKTPESSVDSYIYLKKGLLIFS